MERKSFLKKFIGGIVGVSMIDFTKPFDATEMPLDDKTKDYINKKDFEEEVRKREEVNYTERFASGYVTGLCYPNITMSCDYDYYLKNKYKIS